MLLSRGPSDVGMKSLTTLKENKVGETFPSDMFSHVISPVYELGVRVFRDR